jgi:hypothetical protein
LGIGIGLDGAGIGPINGTDGVGISRNGTTISTSGGESLTVNGTTVSTSGGQSLTANGTTVSTSDGTTVSTSGGRQSLPTSHSNSTHAHDDGKSKNGTTKSESAPAGALVPSNDETVAIIETAFAVCAADCCPHGVSPQKLLNLSICVR